MLMFKKPLLLSLLLGLCLFSTLSLTAEEVVLVYADRMEEVTIFDSAGSEIFADFGTSLYAGYLISLGSSSAELQYRENGTILKLRESSTLKIESFQESEQPKSAHKLSLVRGKMRTVAARLTDSRYSVRTPSSALGIRGTDFIIDLKPGSASAPGTDAAADENPDLLQVLSGKVEALDLRSDRSFLIEGGREIVIGRGNEGIRSLGTELLEQLQESFSFSRLDPGAVPSMEGYSSDFDLRELWEEEGGTVESPEGRSGVSGSGERTSPGKERDSSRTNGSSGNDKDKDKAAEKDRGPGDGETEEPKAPSARLLASFEPGYTLFTSPGIKEISDGGFSLLASFAGRIEGENRIDLGFRVGAIFCTPKLDAVESYTMIPITFFAGVRRSITPLFHFGGEAGLGFQHLLIRYTASTGFPDDQGFTPLVEARLLGGLSLGFLDVEVKAGLSGFYDNGFQLAIPISFGVSMGIDV